MMPRPRTNSLARTFAVFALGSLSFAPLGVSRAEPGEDFSYTMPTAEEMHAMQKRWADACAVGKSHRRLDYFLGTWDTVTRMWMGGEGGEPMVSKGVVESKWLSEGRWVWSEWKGELFGQPYTNWMIIGYDNFRHKYVATVVDNFSTAMNSMTGLLDQSGNTLICYGTIDEPMTGEVGKHVEYITRIIDPDHYTFDVLDLGIGETNNKVFTIDYRRRK